VWNELWLLAAWLTITPPSDLVTDSTSVIMLEFSRNVSVEGILDPENYQVVDEQGKHSTIYIVDIVFELDGITVQDTTLVALVTEKIKYRTLYTVTTNLFQDRNTSSFWFNGFVPLIIDSPTVYFRQESK